MAFSPDGKSLALVQGRQSLHIWDLATGKDCLATTESHEDVVGAFVFLNGGKTLVSGSRDKTVRVWDLASGRLLRTLVHDGHVESVSISGDNCLLAATSTYPHFGHLFLWNFKTGDQLRTWTNDRAGILRRVVFEKEGSSLISGWGNGTPQRWDVSTGAEKPIVQPKLEKLPPSPVGGLDEVNKLVFSPDLRSAGMIGRGWIQVLDLASGNVRFKQQMEDPGGLGHGGEAEFAPDSQSLAVARRGRNLRIKQADGTLHSVPGSTILWLDSQTGQVRAEITLPATYVNCLVFSHDQQFLAMGGLFHPAESPGQRIVRIFRLSDRKEVQTIEAPPSQITGVVFTPDGKQVVVGFSDGTIVIWPVHPAK
jgi:WD40 repeat protein